MFSNIQSMTPKAQDNYNYIISSGKSRLPIMSIIIAKILTDRENLPSSGIEDIRSYYNTTVRIPITQCLSTLNEILQLDIEAIQDYAYKFYCLRYSFMNPAKGIYCANSETAIQDFFGICNYISQADLEIIKQDPMLMTSLYKKISELMDEVLVNKTPSQDITLGENYD